MSHTDPYLIFQLFRLEAKLFQFVRHLGRRLTETSASHTSETTTSNTLWQAAVDVTIGLIQMMNKSRRHI